MLFCNKCGVHVHGNPDYCPLCQGELSGISDADSAFPHIKQKPDILALSIKIAAILTIAAVGICVVIDFALTSVLWGWWLYVAAGAFSFWLIFGIAVTRRQNVSKSIMFTTFIACVITFFWDLCTGYTGWSLDYVLPIACCAAMLTMAVVARILNLQIEQYIYYLILDIVFGIVPLVLLLCGVIRFAPLSVACVAASAISLAALLLFCGKALKAEIIRRTHM